MSYCERPGNKYASGGGGGGTLLYKPYRVCAAPKSKVFEPFCLKTGFDFAHFGLESGMVFEGTMHLSFQFQMSKKEREIWEFEIDFTKS